MCSIDNLKIDLKALPEGESTINADLGEGFFASIDESEISQGDMHVAVSIRKTDHFSEVSYRATGTVQVPCDRCLEMMEQPIDCEQRLTVKMGSEYSEDDDLITIDEEEGILDLSWLIYETITLNIPFKHVHAPGKCNHAMIERLNEHNATRSDDGDEQKEIDPRWSALFKLKTPPDLPQGEE